MEATQEIERKFLLRQLPDDLTSYPHNRIEQGYLVLEGELAQVRLRRKGERRTLTYKRGDGPVREEREIALNPEQFDALWPATAHRRLEKIRYDLPFGERTIEIDVYTGRHAGVVVAEVEFPDEQASRDFLPPDWFGEEVSGNERYSNVRMAQE